MEPTGPPANLGPWLEALLVRELDALERELDLFPDDASVWGVVPGVTNGAGTLALHLCGNLQHYVGAVLGGTGYVRDREREFARRGVPRAELAAEIRRTAAVVRTVLPGVAPDRLAQEYPEAVGGVRLPTGLFLLHVASHFAHHLGQIGYLRRALTGDNRSSGALSLKALQPRTPAA